MSVKLISASAGSGKTYNLAMFYVKLAMTDPDNNYKKILAITFTNAAVNEMKERILHYLHNLSQGKGINDYRNYAKIEKSKQNDSDIKERATKVLNNIIHHYYNFSVSTIDSFLQRLFKATMYEIGIRTNYELIVNNEEIIDQVVKNFLLNIDEKQQPFKWLVKFIKNKVQEDKSFNYEKQLIQLTQEINKEFFYPFENKFASISEEIFEQLEILLKNRINDFIKNIKPYNETFSDLCEKSGLKENDFYQKSRGPASFLGSKLERFIKEKGELNFDLSNKYLKNGKWVSKNSEQKFYPFSESFKNLLKRFVDYIKKEGKQYEDSRIILEQLFNIAILNQIVRNLHEYKKNNNILLLSDIGKMLQNFISKNYLFIYEKLGIRYEYFLIDEFQDTSTVQYQVLKPLIENSISQSNESVLLVGDVKQAIYRWRNGNWKLMKDVISIDFKNNLTIESLKTNYRSYPIIVQFNNTFFSSLVQMNNLYDEKENENEINKNTLSNLVKEIYKNVEQTNPDKEFGNFKGYVKLILKKNKSNNNNENELTNEVEEENDDLKWIAYEVSRLWNTGFKNIGILVRKNNEASLIFDYLTNNLIINDNDFKVISKESLTYANSNAVMWIIFTLYYMQKKSNYAQFMAKSFFKEFAKEKEYVDKYFSNLENNADFKAKNLYFKADYLFNSQYSNLSEREQTFCIQFLQLLKNYINVNPINEASFLQWFFDKGMNESIKIIGENIGVHIVTVHQSKGLEYDAVIIPFVNWSKRVGTNYLWFNKPQWINNSTIPAFLLKSKKDLQTSTFANEYLCEENNQKIDDINLLYVAFTRAKKVLIANVEQKEIGKEIHKLFNQDNAAFNDKLKKFNNLKINKNEKEVIYEIGELKNNNEKYEVTESLVFKFQPSTKPMNLNIVVKDNQELSSQKNIAHGLLIHAIMEQISDITNWKKVAQKVITAYNIANEDKNSIIKSIEKIFEKHSIIRSWFTNSEKIISERKIISNGSIYRPDKIFVHKDKVILVDFKTGETDLEKYKNQVIKYKKLLKELKYNNIESYLLNIDTNELLNVV